MKKSRFLLPALCLSLMVPSLFAQKGPLLSPEVGTDGAVTFRLKAGGAQKVELRGQWDRQPQPLQRGEDGLWSLTLPQVPAGVWEYQFIVDGLGMLDPANPMLKPQRSPSTSILHLPGNPPKPWDYQDVPHGTVHQHSHLSRSLGRMREIWVFTPAHYEADTDRKYPLLVLQHGSGDRHETWVVHGKAHWILDHLIAAKKAVPMVVMMIDGHPLGMVPRDQPDRRAESLRAFQKELLEEALPLVEKTYRIASGPENHAIAGLSMGGWQALSTGMNHLELFGTVGSFSGAVDPAEIQAALAAPDRTNASLRLLWIACGDKDFLLERNQALIAELKDKGIQHEWLLTQGDHSWPVWRGYLADFAPRLFR
ncbi:MAG: hypothetical protein LDL31_08285 [Prosthecobacter sp.]|nr:hypothetical protein [Prosthecobacter sp.]